MIMTPTMSSAQYRYSLAIQFREEQWLKS
jgi:hypothetical protein